MFFGSRLNRLATSIRRGISKYSVGSDNPGLVFDFIDNFYQKDKNQTVNFDGAINHARSGNAVMTDGYGPELVVNGGFDSDSDWGLDAAWQITGGKLVGKATGGVLEQASQTITLTVGKTYIAEYRVIEAENGDLIFDVGTSLTGQSVSTTGIKSHVFVASEASNVMRFRFTGGAAGNETASIDNVSVREMPVIKWAPHNLLTYSEDLGNWTNFNTTDSLNQIAAPDGTTTADKLVEDSSSAVHNIYQTGIIVVSGVDYTFCTFVKQGEYKWLQLSFALSNSTFTVNDFANFDVNAGTVGTTGSGATATIEDVGNGWYKCSVTATAAASASSGATICLTDNTDASSRNPSYAGDGSSGIYVWGMHFNRADLGGMVDNPERGDSYVPTTSSDKYLPRVGHHVYNGSAWVNEGLLAESEQRVNILRDSSISGSNWTEDDVTVTPNATVSPDGTQNADSVILGSTTSAKLIQTTSTTVTGGTEFTVSAYVKENSGSGYFRLIAFDTLNGFGGWFDTSSGEWATTTALNSGTLTGSTVQDVGNGWYRVSLTGTMPSTTALTVWMYITDADNTTTRSSTVSQYQYGFQAEVGSTPSSHIPTSGQQGTREAESFTIPSANLPWPTPQYIGSELVTNGTFDTDSDWTKGTGWSIADGVATANTTLGSERLRSVDPYQGANGKTYIVTATFTMLATPHANAGVRINIGGVGENVFIQSERSLQAGQTYTISGFGTPTNVSGDFHVAVSSTANYPMNYTIDNVSVREINPLSVSIGMEGRMTYADEDENFQIKFLQWLEDGSNFIELSVTTASTTTGRMDFRQEVGGANDFVSSGNTYFSPDILVPFNIASRHGSTFINGAVDGVALTANTTPTALPDLSATDLDLAYDYMGTISEFRVWDKDLGDAGIVEATNPSLEPSLSLTFEGVGTNSFVTNDWSQ